MHDVGTGCSWLAATENPVDCAHSMNNKTIPLGGELADSGLELDANAWQEPESDVAAIPVVGDGYNAEQQK